MKVLIDGWPFENSLQKGIRRYLHELFRRVALPCSIYLESSSAVALPAGCQVLGPLGPFPAGRKNIFRQWRYRRTAEAQRQQVLAHDVFHASFFRTAPHRGIPNVVVVHDMVCEVMPHLFGHYASYEAERKRAAFAKAEAIIAISETTRNDFLTFYPEYRDKLTVVHHGADHFPRQEGEGDMNELRTAGNPFALFVGDRGSYKNFHSLMEAVCDSSWPGELELKVAGPEFEPAEFDALRYRNLLAKVRHVGLITDEELSDLYAKAVCFVFPSLFEGFGFPLLEGQARGVPVVANDMAIFREIGGEGFIPCDCRTPAEIAKAVGRAMEKDTRDRVVRSGLTNVSRFKWDETARKTVGVWQAVAAR